MVFTDQVFLGHLGTKEMAAAALGNMVRALIQSFVAGRTTVISCVEIGIRLLRVCVSNQVVVDSASVVVRPIGKS
jgi:hypothetical protein